ncbi:MAG: hypothetical protein ACJATI_000891 [Halioglobus sp.]|jgi:hypothetical protein
MSYLLKTFLLILLAAECFGQSIDLIKDLNPGFSGGYFGDATLADDKLYFIGDDSFREIYFVNSELEIKKALGSPTVRIARDLAATNNNLYIHDLDGGSNAEIIRYNLTSQANQSILVVNDKIEQKQALSEGVIFVEENENTKDKKVYYIEDGASPEVVIEEINLGQWDLEITESGDYVIFSPMNYSDYDGGVVVYNKLTKQLDSTLFNGLCDNMRYAYGFDNFLIYSCDNNYFIRDLISEENIDLPFTSWESIREKKITDNYIVNSEYIILMPQQNDDLITINKNNLSINVLSEDFKSVIDLHDESGLIYFTEDDYFGSSKLYKSDGTTNLKEELNFSDESIRLKNGAMLNGKAHFVVSYSAGNGFDSDYISILEENDLVLFREVSQGAERPTVFETFGSVILFTSEEPGVGLEFHTLKYPVATSNTILKDDMFFPSITIDGLIRTNLDSDFRFDLIGMTGVLLRNNISDSEISLPYTGTFFINAKNTKNGEKFVQKVIRI